MAAKVALQRATALSIIFPATKSKRNSCGPTPR